MLLASLDVGHGVFGNVGAVVEVDVEEEGLSAEGHDGAEGGHLAHRARHSSSQPRR
jgi:hypothetical protein